jgi:hypothetical protein
MVDPTTAGLALSVVRNGAWLIGVGWRFVRWTSGWKDTPIFNVEWRFYDHEPAEGNAVGRAIFWRTWRRSVAGKWLRTRQRNAPRDTMRLYRGHGLLRDRKIVLEWVAEDRPDTFGALVLAIDEDCREMKGYTVYIPQDTGETLALPIWFRR